MLGRGVVLGKRPGATIAGSRSKQIARTLHALHDVVTCGGVDDCIRRNDASTNETINPAAGSEVWVEESARAG